LPRDEGETLVTEVLWVDRFGNAQLNVGDGDVPEAWGRRTELQISSPLDPSGTLTRSARRATSFAELGSGAIGLVLDSYGMLAIAMNQRSAADELGLAAGDQVVLADLGDDPRDVAADTPVETAVEFGRRSGPDR